VLGYISGISYVCKVMRVQPLNYNMMTDKVSEFLKLQEMINFQIDLTGEASLEIADELEEISNSLNSDEIEYIFEIFFNN
jgi:hypothetical protein